MPGGNFAGTKYPSVAPRYMEDNSDVTVASLFSLKGKVASVTGSSIGIGFAIAEAFAGAGADVAIWYNSHVPDQKVKYLRERYNVKVEAYRVQVTDEEAVEKAIAQQIKDFGKVDILVANAGVITEGLMIDQGEQEYEKMMGVNVKGAYFCAKAVGKHFKERGTGSLVFTASMSSHIVNVPQHHGLYNVSKAAVHHLMRNLAVEWAGFARVNSVSPGYVLTDLVHYAPEELKDTWDKLTPMGRLGLPKEMAGAYLYLASDAASYTTGADIRVDGGYSVP